MAEDRIDKSLPNVRTEVAIPPERQGLRSIMIGDMDD